MSKYTSWLILASACGVTGCKTFGHASDNDLSPSRPIPAIEIPVPPTRVSRESFRPIYVGIAREETSAPPVVDTSLIVRPMSVDMPADNSLSGGLREISKMVVDWKHMAQEAMKSLPAMKTEPMKIEDSSVALPAPIQAAPSVAWLETFWYWTAPMWTAICAYIVAPLVVDILKRRMASRRKHHHRKGRRVQAV